MMPSLKVNRSYPLVAWCVIAAIAGFVLYQHNFSEDKENKLQPEINKKVLEFEGRLQFAAYAAQQQIAQQQGAMADGSKKMERLPLTGSVNRRLCLIVLYSEVDDQADTTKLVERLEADLSKQLSVKVSEEQRQIMNLLKNRASINTTEHKELLQNELGWYANILLYPKGQDSDQRRAMEQSGMKRMLSFGVLAFLGLGLGVAGFVLWVLFFLKAKENKITWQMSASFKQDSRVRHGLYAETFAWWLLLFLILPSLFAHNEWLKTFMFFMSLLALLWPCVRGVPFKVICHDIGLNLGPKPLKEILFSPLMYLYMLPVLALVFLMSALLMTALIEQGSEDSFEPLTRAAHPMILNFKDLNFLKLLLLLIQVSVMAPLVEEIMFRGVLYRHLREWSLRWGPKLSVAVSSIFSAVLFAAIHPQGIGTIPLLAMIAGLLIFSREWRGSLLPGMVAHGIHNGVIFFVIYLMF